MTSKRGDVVFMASANLVILYTVSIEGSVAELKTLVFLQFFCWHGVGLCTNHYLCAFYVFFFPAASLLFVVVAYRTMRRIGN